MSLYHNLGGHVQIQKPRIPRRSVITWWNVLSPCPQLANHSPSLPTPGSLTPPGLCSLAAVEDHHKASHLRQHRFIVYSSGDKSNWVPLG